MQSHPNRQKRTVLGFVLVGAGLVLLTIPLIGARADILWPFFIIVPGATLAAIALASEAAPRALAVPGTVISGIGVILLVQNTFDHYESWAYAWALIPFCVGLGTSLAAADSAGDHDKDAGQHLMMWSAITFIALAILFEVFIFGGGFWGARIIIPLGLIVVGAAFLLRPGDDVEAPAETPAPDDEP